ncbi:MAG: DUF6745 domain-containing protein [Cyanobacteria bacterium P01_F01_bin.42]
MSQIRALTAAQTEQIPTYRDRWWQTLSSTQTINRVKAEAAVGWAYEAAGYQVPQVQVVRGPHDFRDLLNAQPLPQQLNAWGAPIVQLPLGRSLAEDLRSQLNPELWAELVDKLDTMRLAELSLEMYSAVIGPVVTEVGQLEEPAARSQSFTESWLEQLADHQWQAQERFWKDELRRQPGGDLLLSLGETVWDFTQPLNQWIDQTLVQPLREDPLIHELETGVRQLFGFFSLFGLGIEALEASATEFYPVLLDYGQEVLGCSLDETRWSALRSLHTDCGPLLTFEKICFVFERPTQLSFDDQGRMHREGEPAIAFDDGYGQYFFQGVRLPPKYGAVHPNLWRSHWILQEPNAELRRILILGIGYSRICQELQAVELDSWREYTLLRIDLPIDIEPVFLLKMSCPSTGSVHASRVPPSVTTAREAIRWMNWDIDPEEFGSET